MKSIILSILLICFSSNIVFADCDWSTIKKNADKTFSYSEELHLCVGRLVQDNAVKDQQIQDLTKAISLKDLAIKDSDTRSQMWMNTATTEQDRMSKIALDQSHSEWLYFGLGVLTVIGAGFMTAKLVK